MRVKITHSSRILFPKSKITKKEFIAYYQKIAKKILPLIKDRPVSMQRFPEGIQGEIFFQKKVSSYFPKWLKKVSVKREGKENINMAICNDLDSLLYLANQICVLHIWLSKKGKLNYPDRLIFDLDPSGNNFSKIIEAALDLKKILDQLDLPSFIMTTGSKGLHIVIPIKPKLVFDQARNLARSIASLLVLKYPQKYTIEPRLNKRKNKVFIDYLRNAFAQTAVAPYSIRPIESGPIAMPLEWKELSNKKLSSQSFNIKNCFKRKKDPWKNFDKKSISLEKAINKIEKLTRIETSKF